MQPGARYSFEHSTLAEQLRRCNFPSAPRSVHAPGSALLLPPSASRCQPKVERISVDPLTEPQRRNAAEAHPPCKVVGRERIGAHSRQLSSETSRSHFTPLTCSESHRSAPSSPRVAEDRRTEITLPRLTSRVRIPSPVR